MDVEYDMQRLVDRAFGSYVEKDVIILDEQTIAEEGTHEQDTLIHA